MSGKHKTGGDALKASLEYRMILQKEFAATIGVSPQFICDIVHGRRIPNAEMVRKILNGLMLRGEERVAVFMAFKADALSEWYRLEEDIRASIGATVSTL